MYNNITGASWNQAWVGVQHTAPGAFLSVGHSATELNNSFGNCINDSFYRALAPSLNSSPYLSQVI